MPKIGVKPEEMKEFLTTIKYKKLIGVCFMSIFEKQDGAKLWITTTS